MTVTPAAGQTGSATLTVRVSDGELHNDYTIAITVHDVPLATSVSVTSEDGGNTVESGSTLQMLADVQPANVTDASWSVIPGSGTADISPAGVLTGGEAGTVTVRATANDGSGAYGEMVVTVIKASQTISFPLVGNQVATAVVGLSATASSGLPVAFEVLDGPAILSGGTNLSFSGIGSVTVGASQAGNASFFSASTSQTLTVNKAAATVTLLNIAQAFDGSPKPVSTTVSPEGLPVSVTYDGSSEAPSAVGTYAVTGTVNHALYEGSANGTLQIQNAPEAAVVTQGGADIPSGTPPSAALGTDFGSIRTNASASVTLTLTNRGSAMLILGGVTTNGAGAGFFSANFPSEVAAGEGVEFTVEYVPLGAGAHNAAFSLNHNGGDSPFVLECAGVGVDDGEIGVSVSTISLEGRYNEAETAPGAFAVTNVGGNAFSYTNEIRYGAQADWLEITPATGSATAGGAAQPHAATASLAGLNAGVYEATNWIVSGDALNSPVPMRVQLTVLKGTQHVDFAAIDAQVTTNVLALGATAASGLGVTFRVVDSPAVIADGTNLSFTGTGTVTVIASQAGDANWMAADEVTRTFDVAKAEAQVALENLARTYDGSAQPVSATTVPEGLSVVFTYDGLSWAPTNAGSYAVTGTVVDALYQGSQAGTLIVAKAQQAIDFAAIAPKKATGSVGLSATASSGLGVTFAVGSGPGDVDGTNLTFSGVGDVRVVASQAGDDNYLSAPDITNVVKVFSVDPESGLIDGGNAVVVTNGVLGNGSDIEAVSVGGVPVETITGQGGNWVSFIAPTFQQTGIKEIAIQSAGLGETVLPEAYEVKAAGVITDVSPSSGSAAGGYEVTISGTNLCNGMSYDLTDVTLCGVGAGGIVSVAGSTQIVITAGACTSGAATGDVRVFSASFGETVLSNAFEYTEVTPVAGPVTVWRATNNVNMKIPDFLLLTNSSCPELSPMSIVWVSSASTNGANVSVEGRWVYFDPPANDGEPDAFQFRVRNAYGGEAESTAEVIVITPASEGQSLNISGVTPSATNTLVRFAGIPGRAYDVQSTTNLVHTPWAKIGDVVIGAQGFVIFTDTNQPVGQFYRTARPE